jgi:hypothetical protein
MKEWIIDGRFEFDGHAIVEADTAEEAKQKFEAGDFEFDHVTASVCNWARRGQPKDCS